MPRPDDDILLAIGLIGHGRRADLAASVEIPKEPAIARREGEEIGLIAAVESG